MVVVLIGCEMWCTYLSRSIPTYLANRGRQSFCSRQNGLSDYPDQTSRSKNVTSSNRLLVGISIMIPVQYHNHSHLPIIPVSLGCNSSLYTPLLEYGSVETTDALPPNPIGRRRLTGEDSSLLRPPRGWYKCSNRHYFFGCVRWTKFVEH